jgi:nucleosome binding factor SPN SPT16 subunit
MQAWLNSFDQSQLEKVDISLGLALLLAVKDESELVSTVAQSLSFHFYMIYDFLCFYVIYFDLFLSYHIQDACKRAAVLTNKVLKHSFVTEMESIIDDGKKTKHDELATKVN